MFNDITVNHSYLECLKTAAVLDSTYDYISFSDFDEQDVKVTNCLYLTVLHNTLEKANKKDK